MSLKAYARRKTGVDEVGREMRGDLTSFECRLLQRQEVVVIRGKTGRGVPVILPSDVKLALGYLTNPEVRIQAGIPPENPYVFGNNGAGVFRAYDAIREVARLPEAGLQKPDLIRTSNMRKYMATMLQALDTTESERQWVVDHLGHTMDVHRIHYRQTSYVLERVDVAKILLIQDMGLVSKYKGKRIQDIQLDEIFLESPQDSVQEVTANSSAQTSAGVPDAGTSAGVPDAGTSAGVTKVSALLDSDSYSEFVPGISEEVDSEGDEEELIERKKGQPRHLPDRDGVRKRLRSWRTFLLGISKQILCRGRKELKR